MLSAITFNALTFAMSLGRCWKPRPSASVFNTSHGTWRVLMHEKPYLVPIIETFYVYRDCAVLQYETAHDKTYNKTYTTSEDSVQPAHAYSLIRVGWSHVPSTASGLSEVRWTRTLAILGGRTCWSESLLVTQILSLSCARSYLL